MDIFKGKPKPKNKKNDFPDSSFNFLSEKTTTLYPNADQGETGQKNKKNNVKKKLLIIAVSVLLVAIFSWMLYFGWKLHSVSKKINIENENSVSLGKDIKSVVSNILTARHKVLKGEEEGRINILLLGAAGEGNPGKNLTDTIMVMSINTKTKKVALLSLPRDLYVNVPGSSYYTKINSVYQYGINNNQGAEPIKKVAEEVTGLEIQYFLILDFEGFKKIIDDLEGINVFVEKDIYDSRYPGPNYSYETFEIKKGLHAMDGDTALKYVRERHADSEGDFGRAKRQQQTIQATKNKMFSLQTFLNVFTLNDILNTLGNHIETNIQFDEIESFIYWSKQVDSQNIANKVVDAWKKESLLKVSHVYYENTRVFILVPRVGNYSETHDLAQNIFDLDKIQKRQEEIEKEKASLVLINESGNKNLEFKIKSLLEEKINLKNIKIISSRNKTVRRQTIVCDNTAGKKVFTLDELLKKLPASLTSDQDNMISTNNNSDFIVILGKDLEENYNYEEDSIEDLNNANYDQVYLELINNQ